MAQRDRSWELERRVWDAVVVGAGPAGSIASTVLARAGCATLLLDRERFPREKVCGDGLIQDAVNCLSRLGLLDEVDAQAYRTRRASVFSPARYEVAIEGDFRTVRRDVLDDLLARAATRSGADFAMADVASIEQCAPDLARVRVRGEAAPIDARVVLIATGADIALAKSVGLVSRPGHSAVAVRTYVHSTRALDRLVVSYDRSILPGYAWIFPMGGGVFNVGCGVFHARRGRAPANLRSMLDRFLAEFPIARELMDHATDRTPLRGAALRCGLSGAIAHREGTVLAIGETLGATFPFTGEGIGKAMETGEIAGAIVAEAITRGEIDRLAALPARLGEVLAPRYRGYEIAERWLSIPWLNDFVGWRARKSASLRRALEGILNETVDPEDVFSVRALVASFLR